MTGICLPKGMIGNPKIQEIVLKKFQGILIRTPEDIQFYVRHKKELSGSLIEINNAYWDTWGRLYPELRKYADELFTNHKKEWEESFPILISLYPDIIFGDLTKEAFEEIRSLYPRASVTYTAYCEWGFTFLGIRFYKWWKDQRKVWDWLFINGYSPKILWVEPAQKKLIEYARLCKVDCYVYTETTDVDSLIRELESI